MKQGLFQYCLAANLAFYWLCATPPTTAQIVPDTTLGAENSVVTPLDELSDRIDGGAIRGTNLFHSFQEFNIGEGRGLYFANPAQIQNILTRVTGGNPSNILGILGVARHANLFLINPNGIIFGKNANLNVQRSRAPLIESKRSRFAGRYLPVRQNDRIKLFLIMGSKNSAIAHSIASGGIIVSIAWNTSAASMSGEINENSLSCMASGHV